MVLYLVTKRRRMGRKHVNTGEEEERHELIKSQPHNTCHSSYLRTCKKLPSFYYSHNNNNNNKIIIIICKFSSPQEKQAFWELDLVGGVKFNKQIKFQTRMTHPVSPHIGPVRKSHVTHVTFDRQPAIFLRLGGMKSYVVLSIGIRVVWVLSPS